MKNAENENEALNKTDVSKSLRVFKTKRDYGNRFKKTK